MTKRVFHPTLNSYVDVPDKDVDSWAEQGWKKTQPKHVTVADDAPAPGDHPGIAAIPVLEDTSRTASGSSGSAATGSAPSA